jgi:hypothetical protein
LGLGWIARAADATTPVDYTQRNGPFAPGASIAPEKNAPAIDRAVQDRRIEKPTVAKPAAAIGQRRAAIEVGESRDKTVRDANVRSPELVNAPRSALNHRAATISPAADLRKPPLVTRYQEEMAAASAHMMAVYPALDRATTAKINRFVFRKNNPEPLPATDGAAATPAAGGSSVRK